MPTVIPQYYFLDAPSLGSASSVFLDSSLSVCAPNGFYSDGIITRELVDCVLLPQQMCESCGISCGGTITAGGSSGVYILNIDSGSSIGAVKIRFNPVGVPDGIIVNYDGVSYNKLSSEAFQELVNPIPNTPTYVGNSSQRCSLLISGGSTTLNEFIYNGTSFIASGNTQTVNVNTAQVLTTSVAPGNCYMIIPKTSASPSVLNISVYGVCSSTGWDIEISCPEVLPSFPSSLVAEDAASACLLTEDQTYYVAYVNGTPSGLSTADFVFSDSNGEMPLADGWYKSTACIAPSEVFHVTAGIIDGFDNC